MGLGEGNLGIDWGEGKGGAIKENSKT